MKREKILKRLIINVKVSRHYALMLEDRMLVDCCEKIVDELNEELKEEKSK